MKYTLRHYYDFKGSRSLGGGSLQSAQAWDELRSDQGLEHAADFYMPESREEWAQLARQAAGINAQAHALAGFITRENFSSLVSCGVGRAFLEFHVKQVLPGLKLTCTEYSPQVVARLRRVFPECDRIECHDFTRAGWPPPGDRTLYLLNRVDTELDDRQWPTVFANLAAENVRHVLVVATAFLTPRVLASELKRHVLSRLCRRPLTFAGYVRTRDAFTELWRPRYRIASEVPVGDLTGFLLARADSAN